MAMYESVQLVSQVDLDFHTYVLMRLIGKSRCNMKHGDPFQKHIFLLQIYNMEK